jgi:catechol 2,3-dioxygenase-like lactoylglutathione lyase family enzyme
MSAVTGLSHVAVNTADLDRFRRFYEDLLGIPMAVSMRMTQPPYLRHAMFQPADATLLHVFEVPGYDPQAQGIGADIGERGRVDHFAFMVRDHIALAELSERLQAAGATDGTLTDFGPVLSLHLTDPDGLQLELNCVNPDFDPVAIPAEEIEELPRPDWIERVAAEVQRAAAHA